MPGEDRRFKSDIYEQFAKIGKALGNPSRLELLDLLCEAPRTVEVLAKAAGLSVANTSRHLQVLRSASLVEGSKNGLYVEYRIGGPAVCQLITSIRTLAEDRLAEVERITRRFLDGKQGMDPVDRDELIQRVREGSVTVLDVRPEEEYRAGHIAGALSLPLEQLESRLGELPKDQEIVAYCRGPYCVMSVKAVEILRARGFSAARLEDSVREWASRGLPVAAEKDSGRRQKGRPR